MSILTEYPEIIALLIVVAGFILASYASAACRSLLGLIERTMHRFTPARQSVLNSRVQTVIVRLIYYLVLGFFLVIALRSLGVSVLTDWLDLIIVYIPQVLVGAFIIVGGYLLSILARTLVGNLVGEAAGELVPRMVQYLVIIATTVTGLGQMAINISFLSAITIVVLAALLGGLALAFALGSKDVVANLLARRELGRLQVGDHIRIEGAQGRIIELTRTGVIVDSGDEYLTIPATRLINSIVAHRAPGQDA